MNPFFGKNKELDPKSLRALPPSPYVYRSKVKIRGMRLMDGIGNLVFRKPAIPIPWDSVTRVAVLRLNQIGDSVLALPVLAALCRLVPQATVDFWVGPRSQEMAGLSGLRIGSQVFEAPWASKLNRRSKLLGAIRGLSKRLGQNRYEVAIDLRGDIRNIVALKLARIPYRIGSTLMGGGFLLTHPVSHVPGLSESEQGLNLLKQAGLNMDGQDPLPRLVTNRVAEGAAEEMIRALGLTKPFITLQATCVSPAKYWETEKWRELMGRLPETYDLVLVGAERERAEMERIGEGLSRRVAVAAGFSLGTLAAFLKKSSLFIGIDSGPGHMAAALGVKVLSIFSGAHLATQWGPRGSKAHVIQRRPLCSPCELKVCPIGLGCMRDIGVEEVLDSARAFLDA